MRYRGTDVTDSGFEVRPGEDVSDVEVVLTDQISNVSGLVTNSRGDTVKDYWTVVFARDRDKWAAGRYVRTSRGDQDGRFKFTGLPAAEYLVIAVDVARSRRGERSGIPRSSRNPRRRDFRSAKARRKRWI